MLIVLSICFMFTKVLLYILFILILYEFSLWSVMEIRFCIDFYWIELDWIELLVISHAAQQNLCCLSSQRPSCSWKLSLISFSILVDHPRERNKTGQTFRHTNGCFNINLLRANDTISLHSETIIMFQYEQGNLLTFLVVVVVVVGLCSGQKKDSLFKY